MSSDGESINEWTLDEIDLDKPLVDLHTILDDRRALNEALFEYLNKNEIYQIFGKPENDEKDDLDIEYLKELCLAQLERLSKKKIIKLLNLELDGKLADIHNLGEENEIEGENKAKERKKESPDDIQMNVDDQEYEEFLKNEFNNSSLVKRDDHFESKSNSFKNDKPADSSDGSLFKGKLSKKEQQNLINELAFPRASSENLDNCDQNSAQDEKGWQNLWNQTQLEIQELEMRANAIKAMMEKSKSKSIDKSDEKNSNQLLDNIESENDYLTDGEYKNESELSNSRDEEPRRSRSKSYQNHLDSIDKMKLSKSKNRSRSPNKERRSSKERAVKKAKAERRSKSRNKNKGSPSKSELVEKKRFEKRSASKERFSGSRERRSSSEFLDEEKQIRRAVEGEFLDIKIDIKTNQKRADKRNKKVGTKPDVNRLSMESGEILDDDSDNEVIEVIEAKKMRRPRSPSVTSSIDSFGRNRRRRRRRSFSEMSRNPPVSRESASFSSLDEILREAELEEQYSIDSKPKTRLIGNRMRHVVDLTIIISVHIAKAIVINLEKNGHRMKICTICRITQRVKKEKCPKPTDHA